MDEKYFPNLTADELIKLMKESTANQIELLKFQTDMIVEKFKSAQMSADEMSKLLEALKPAPADNGNCYLPLIGCCIG